MMPFKCSNRFKIVFVHLRLSFNAVNTVSIFVQIVRYIKLLVKKCALMHVFFGDDQSVRLLEHVR